MKKNLANYITSSRLIGALVLIGIEANTKMFLIVYSLCGLTDAIDGFVARKFKIESEYGRKLDSLSDLMLNGVMLVKVWPLLEAALSRRALYLIMALISARGMLYLVVGIIYHHLLSTHSIWNKLVSILMFFLPYALMFSFARYYCYLIMSIAAFSILDEVYHLFTSSRTGDPVNKEAKDETADTRPQ